MIIAGIDEAGYGPLLGPLVVSATAVEVPGELIHEPEAVPCLWRMLRGAVAKKNAGAKGRLLIADSKVVHNLAEGDRFLERGVLAFARAADGQGGGAAMPGSLDALLKRFGCTNHELERHPWYATADVGLPWLCEAGDLAIASNVLAASLKSAGATVAALRTAVLSEGVFNKLVDETHNKASALVSVTLAHLYWLHTTFGERGLMVTVDKQGGRDHYTALLLRSFPEATLKVLQESAALSAYLLQEGRNGRSRRTVIVFREKGEAHSLPTALASMMCKYIRELCMHAFNAWWCGQVAGLQPTAGYYQDGTRWLMDVEPHLARLGVRREMLVRVK